jgi:hypothetical protein
MNSGELWNISPTLLHLRLRVLSFFSATGATGCHLQPRGGVIHGIHDEMAEEKP